ncbi:hypothetical protein LIER_33564 [Lithospermum erythrorhizon]|uniref:RING-type domain-containing protein n=1 Tax=Lithospermum erythrorhizon TaxID=34254 RepID=A0AAV3RX12_LITER
MSDMKASETISNITVGLIAAACAGILMTIYHCVSTNGVRNILNLGPRGGRTNHLHDQQLQTLTISRGDHQATQRSIETSSIVQLVPSYKYQKRCDNDKKAKVEVDDGMCPVCLSDFKDGEDVRTLPNCLHTFHATCIDMWLFSHTNCPICRTIATPCPRLLQLHLINSNSDTPIAANIQNHHNSPVDTVV